MSRIYPHSSLVLAPLTRAIEEAGGWAVDPQNPIDPNDRALIADENRYAVVGHLDTGRAVVHVAPSAPVFDNCSVLLSGAHEWEWDIEADEVARFYGVTLERHEWPGEESWR